MSASPADAIQEGAEFALETVEGGVKEFAAWNNDDIKTCGRFVVLEQLPHLALGAVSHDGAADFARRRNPEPGYRFVGSPGEDRHEPPVYTGAGLVSPLKIRPPANVLGAAKRHRSSETVRRLRPLARRRFNTC